MIVLENVCGILTSRSGQDFAAIASAFTDSNYVFGAMTIDARLWVPQSRRRLFFIGVRGDLTIPERLLGEPSELWHSKSLRTAHTAISKTAHDRWIWWNLPQPRSRSLTLAEIIEESPRGAMWNSPEETSYLISLMAPLHRKKLDSALDSSKLAGVLLLGAVYRRRRNGQQRAEIRFDDVAGCLRTPVGGSSRQTIIFVENGQVRSRLLTPREAARLMGLPENYVVPEQYNQAYHLCGDGVVVPVVHHLAAHILEPVWAANRDEKIRVSRAA